MKLAYIILAHQDPKLVVRLVKRLISGGSVVSLHYDLNSRKEDFTLIQQALSAYEGQVFYADRVCVEWGKWSIVQATLNALAQLTTMESKPDYVHLMSGMDYPIRSELELSAFLERNRGIEFIQSVNLNSGKWVKDGLSCERFEYHHYLNWQKHKKLFDINFKIQKKFLSKRKFPSGFTPHMGSQWWTLTWPTCELILNRSKNLQLINFFKTVWIPDEMYIQTLVAEAVPKSKIFGKCLTLYQFNHNGIPLVFTNGHQAYLSSQPFFFARKISPYADGLRDELDRYHEGQVSPLPQSDEDFGVCTKEYEYFLKRSEDLTKGGRRIIGLVKDVWYGDLEWNDKPYYVIVGGSKTELKIVQEFLNKQPGIICHGDLFSSKRIDFIHNVDEYGDFKAEDTALRDHSRPNFLVQLMRKDMDKIFAFLLPFGEGGDFLDVCLWDKNSRIITLKTNPFLLYRDYEKEINAFAMWAEDLEDNNAEIGGAQFLAFLNPYQKFLQHHEKFWSTLYSASPKNFEIRLYDKGRLWGNEMLGFIERMESETEKEGLRTINRKRLARRITQNQYEQWLKKYGDRERTLTGNNKPYYIIVGGARTELKIVQDFLNQQPGIICHGMLFSTTRMDFAGGMDEYAGFKAEDIEDIEARDHNRQNFLVQILRKDMDKTVVFLLPFGEGGGILDICLWDKNARIIALKTNPFILYREHKEEIDASAMWMLRPDDSSIKNYAMYYARQQSAAFFKIYQKFYQQHELLLGKLRISSSKNTEICLYDNEKIWMNQLVDFIDQTEMETEKEIFGLIERAQWKDMNKRERFSGRIQYGSYDCWLTSYDYWLTKYYNLHGDREQLARIFNNLNADEQAAFGKYAFFGGSLIWQMME